MKEAGASFFPEFFCMQQVVFVVSGNTFAHREQLRRRSYCWSPEYRVWVKSVSPADEELNAKEEAAIKEMGLNIERQDAQRFYFALHPWRRRRYQHRQWLDQPREALAHDEEKDKRLLPARYITTDNSVLFHELRSSVVSSESWNRRTRGRSTTSRRQPRAFGPWR